MRRIKNQEKAFRGGQVYVWDPYDITVAPAYFEESARDDVNWVSTFRVTLSQWMTSGFNLKLMQPATNNQAAVWVFGWSFYRQGTVGGTSSADEFLDAALTWFGDPDPRVGTAWAKGERLASISSTDQAKPLGRWCKPGAMQLTRIPKGAHSAARHLVSM